MNPLPLAFSTLIEAAGEHEAVNLGGDKDKWSCGPFYVHRIQVNVKQLDDAITNLVDSYHSLKYGF